MNECTKPVTHRCGECAACKAAAADREAKRCKSTFTVMDDHDAETMLRFGVRLRSVGCRRDLPHETHSDGIRHEWTDAESEQAGRKPADQKGRPAEMKCNPGEGS